MLHVGVTGILKYIFEYLDNLIAGDIDKETFDVYTDVLWEMQNAKMSITNPNMDCIKLYC